MKETCLALKGCAVIVAFAIASSGCAPIEPQKPINQAAEATSNYLSAKRAYVETLEKAIRYSDPAGSPYRLIAVVGPQWRVGQVVDLENPLNPVTDKCLFDVEKLPKPPTPWGSLPGLSNSRKIDFSAGLPDSVLDFLGKDNTLGVNFNMARSGEFALNSLESTIPAQDVFEASLSEECKEVLALKGGLVVRGVVAGKEKFKSGGSLSAGVNLKVVETQLFKLQYDNSGDNFELEDAAVAPKMFMVAYFPKQDRSASTVSRRAPSNQEILKLEQARIK